MNAVWRKWVVAILASDQTENPTFNLLPPLASVAGVLVGVFLVLGAYGHFTAVWPTLVGSAGAPVFKRLMLIVPSVVLVLTGVMNIGFCRLLWTRVAWTLKLALMCNLATVIYLTYLMITGIAGHPIGLFLALSCSYVLVLGAIRAGLVWPAVNTDLHDS